MPDFSQAVEHVEILISTLNETTLPIGVSSEEQAMMIEARQIIDELSLKATDLLVQLQPDKEQEIA